jgi:hypothetical protein
MKHLLLTLIFGLTFFACNQRTESNVSSEDQIEKAEVIDNSSDKEEIQNLIRKALHWADSANLDLLPAIAENGDTVYTGFDFEIVEQNLNKLRETGFFSKAFIDNYNQIMLTIDKKIKAAEYSYWLVGDMPPFNFTSDVNPWCYCQEIPDDKRNSWDLVKVTIIKLDKDSCDLTWTWGQAGWSDYEYSLGAKKENGRWTISHMQGFDYNESIKGY